MIFNPVNQLDSSENHLNAFIPNQILTKLLCLGATLKIILDHIFIEN